MSRYRTFGQLDDADLDSGDEQINGFRSAQPATKLPAGVASYLGNMRCEMGKARVRKGTKAVSTSIVLSTPPLLLNFTLGNDISVTSLTRSGTTATATTATPHGFTTGDWVAIEHVATANWNGDYQVTVTDSTHFTFIVPNTLTTPATGSMTANKGPQVFESYENIVYASCEYSDQDQIEGAVIATSDRAFAYRDGIGVTSLMFPAGEIIEATDDASMVQFLGSVYLFRGYKTADAIALSGITRSSTTATATSAAAHGLTTGQWVTIAGAGGSDGFWYNGIFKVTVTDSTHFTYTVGSSSATTPPTGTLSARPCKPPLVWDGKIGDNFVVVPTGANTAGGTLIAMPATPWAVPFNRQLVMYYSPNEIIRSDFGDAASFDTQYAEQRILPGSSDFLVYVAPYQQVKILVLYRKSVHLIVLNPATLAVDDVAEITRAVGCVGRNSVQACGDKILWLSDTGQHGVVQLQIGLELNLTQAQQTLSAPIQDIIDRINWAYADGAVAKYWKNRYYLAVPLDGSKTNNAVLVYNFVNQEWESVDTFPGSFDVQNMLVIDYAGAKRLHFATTFGFLFLAEEQDTDDYGTTSLIATYVIAGQLNTRLYTMGELNTRSYTMSTEGEKIFTTTTVEGNAASTADAFGVTFVTRNKDGSKALPAFAGGATTDFTYRHKVKMRGTAGGLQIATTGGRPEFRGIEVTARSGRHAPRTRE